MSNTHDFNDTVFHSESQALQRELTAMQARLTTLAAQHSDLTAFSSSASELHAAADKIANVKEVLYDERVAFENEMIHENDDAERQYRAENGPVVHTSFGDC